MGQASGRATPKSRHKSQNCATRPSSSSTQMTLNRLPSMSCMEIFPSRVRLIRLRDEYMSTVRQ
jgi:hypothetical protein